MLDLKELERKLDEALENETSESLTRWLLAKRYPNIGTLLGAGSFVSLKEFNCSITGIAKSKATSIYSNDYIGEANFEMAA